MSNSKSKGLGRGLSALMANVDHNTAASSDTRLIVSSGETNLAIEKGAKSVIAMATHPVLSGPAVKRLSDSALSKIIVCDTIYLEKQKIFDKLEVISVASVFAEAIKHIVEGTSLSSMFKL